MFKVPLVASVPLVIGVCAFKKRPAAEAVGAMNAPAAFFSFAIATSAATASDRSK